MAFHEMAENVRCPLILSTSVGFTDFIKTYNMVYIRDIVTHNNNICWWQHSWARYNRHNFPSVSVIRFIFPKTQPWLLWYGKYPKKLIQERVYNVPWGDIWSIESKSKHVRRYLTINFTSRRYSKQSSLPLSKIMSVS